MRLRPFSLSDALNLAEMNRERQVLDVDLEGGDYPHPRLHDTGDGEREPE
jgi:hypothetical protein